MLLVVDREVQRLLDAAVEKAKPVWAAWGDTSETSVRVPVYFVKEADGVYRNAHDLKWVVDARATVRTFFLAKEKNSPAWISGPSTTVYAAGVGDTVVVPEGSLQLTGEIP